MGNNQSSGAAGVAAATPGAPGPGGHRRSGSRSQPSAAAASLSTFQNQATLHRLRQHQQRQSSAKSTATQSSLASTPGGRASRGTSPAGRSSVGARTPASLSDPYNAQTPTSPGGTGSDKPTSPASIASVSSSGGNGPRRRKSIELPDLDPSLAFTNAAHTTGSSAATPLADVHMSPYHRSGGALPGGKRGFGDLSSFKLRLPDKQRARLLDLASSSGSSVGHAAEAQMRTGIEAMRLDEGEDHPGDGPAGLRSTAPDAKSSLAPSAPTQTSDGPGGDASDQTLKGARPSGQAGDASTGASASGTPSHLTVDYTTIRPVHPEIEIEGTSAASPSAIAPDTDTLPIGITQAPYGLASSPSVLIPLQQPIETVVPPLPPTIMKPFPPPLPVAPVSSSSSAAAVHKVAAATEAVRQAPALDVGAGPEGVPTLIIWKEPANEVYVTGTFCRWKQQIKLRKDPYVSEVPCIPSHRTDAYPLQRGTGPNLLFGPRLARPRSASAQVHRGQKVEDVQVPPDRDRRGRQSDQLPSSRTGRPTVPWSRSARDMVRVHVRQLVSRHGGFGWHDRCGLGSARPTR